MNRRQNIVVALGILVLGVVACGRGSDPESPAAITPSRSPSDLWGPWVTDWQYYLERSLGERVTVLRRETSQAGADMGEVLKAEGGITALLDATEKRARDRYHRIMSHLVLREDLTWDLRNDDTALRGTWRHAHGVVTLVVTHRNDEEVAGHIAMPFLYNGSSLVGRAPTMDGTTRNGASNRFTRKE